MNEVLMLEILHAMERIMTTESREAAAVVTERFEEEFVTVYSGRVSDECIHEMVMLLRTSRSLMLAVFDERDRRRKDD